MSRTTTARRRVLVLLEPGRGGAAAVDLARQLAEDENADVTIAGEVPQAPSGSRCGNSATEYNTVVRETVMSDLLEARGRLGAAVDGVSLELLIEGSDPPLGDWVASADFDIVLLPARRRPLRSVKHPAAAGLRCSTRADVRIVDPRQRSSASP